MFEYTYGEVPTLITEPPLNIKMDEDESNGRPSEDANVWISLYNFFAIFIVRIERFDYLIIPNVFDRSLILVIFFWMKKLILVKTLIWMQEAILIGEMKMRNNLSREK